MFKSKETLQRKEKQSEGKQHLARMFRLLGRIQSALEDVGRSGDEGRRDEEEEAR